MKKIFRKLSLFLILILALSGCSKSGKAEKDVLTETEPTTTEVTTTQYVPKVSDVKISVVGDLMVHSWQYNEAYDPSTGEYDFIHNFTDVKKYFADSDLVIGNLETTFAGKEIGYSDYPCFNTPDAFGDAIKDAGFNFLTTANNHCMDKHKDGLLRTLDVLDGLGIDHTGTFRSQEERDNIFIRDYNGIKIAILSYTYGTNGINVPDDYLVNLMDEDLIKSDLKRARELNPDIIIVLPHMGNEYETYPKQVFQDWADMMFEGGADIILASHPHVLQPMEYKTIVDENGEEREGFIIYSLGNFISSQTTPPRNAGVILNIELEKVDDEKPEIKQVSFIPTWTQFRNGKGEDDFVVRSVYEMLTLPEEEQTALLRKKDIARLKDIHSETTKMLLGEDIPLEDIQDEYVFPKSKKDFIE